MHNIDSDLRPKESNLETLASGDHGACSCSNLFDLLDLNGPCSNASG